MEIDPKLALEAYQEVAQEVEGEVVPDQVSLYDILDIIGSLPKGALFIGVASDGMPLLMNLNDPALGPVLITGDPDAGAADVMRVIARAASKHYLVDELTFAVLSNNLNEWREPVDITDMENCTTAASPDSQTAEDLLLSLVTWAHNKHTATQHVILFIDDLTCVQRMDMAAQQNLRWLLLRGPARHVWVIATIPPVPGDAYDRMEVWMNFFRVRIYGKVAKMATATPLPHLEPGLEFVIRENKDWLHFWLPK